MRKRDAITKGSVEMETTTLDGGERSGLNRLRGLTNFIRMVFLNQMWTVYVYL